MTLRRALRLSKKPNFKAVLAYRLRRWEREHRDRWLYLPLVLILLPVERWLSWSSRVLYDIHIADSADIGPGFFVAHLGGIRVGRCRIGAHCTIHQMVEIDAEGDSESGPAIGDRVWIGPHVRVLGSYTIGSRATLSAGSEPRADVDAGCLAMGSPARIMKRDYDNTDMLDPRRPGSFGLWSRQPAAGGAVPT